MKRNQIEKLQVHFVPAPDGQTIAERANHYHVQLIERRLDASGFTNQQKAEVLEKIKSHITFSTND